MSAMLVSLVERQASGMLWNNRSGRSKWPPCAKRLGGYTFTKIRFLYTHSTTMYLATVHYPMILDDLMNKPFRIMGGVYGIVQ